jgi:hypothetical protein
MKAKAARWPTWPSVLRSLSTSRAFARRSIQTPRLNGRCTTGSRLTPLGSTTPATLRITDHRSPPLATAGGLPYTAECNVIIEALSMANDAKKVVFFGDPAVAKEKQRG